MIHIRNRVIFFFLFYNMLDFCAILIFCVRCVRPLCAIQILLYFFLFVLTKFVIFKKIFKKKPITEFAATASYERIISIVFLTYCYWLLNEPFKPIKIPIKFPILWMTFLLRTRLNLNGLNRIEMDWPSLYL